MYINAYGYELVQVEPRRWKGKHIVVAEKALGHVLPKDAVVHHVNGDRLDNRPENLVICPNRAYHNLLHRRMDALSECGHADWHRCGYCHKHDAAENMLHDNTRYRYFHAQCARDYNNTQYAKRKIL